ncbi:uncharacterized protein UV8b_00427 [Ustilaginoidea virens]|uniref:Eliciting plant response-like protein n=1 Tax=Ustilaginoidea virens TaxID=1159556 RepID=A0A8E5MDH2_USTVR|nr:uncharacterized protein UV8b_00427 [Ustilaginoidea virens]QUC16186.1 hypothetical protein UV8b_00427 [Ustilaginoidea virens]
MRFSNAICAAVMATATSAVRVSWDGGYNEAGRSMGVVSCSDGSHGLMNRYPTQGNLPNYPFIGGTDAIGGWGSGQCGTCWQLEYQGHKIKILAIDHAASGFNINPVAMDALTNGRAYELGRVDATVTQLSARDCGL